MYIASIEQVKVYEKVANSLAFSSLSPYESVSITKHLHHLWSVPLMDQLEGYSTETEGTDKRRGYEYFKGSIVRLSIYESIAAGEVVYGEGGITRTENSQVKTAYAGQIRRLEQRLLDSAFAEINALIDLMDANPSLFTEWTSSPGSLLNQEYLIRTSTEFVKYEALFRPFITFRHLLPSMMTQQDFYLRTGFESSLITELIANAALSSEKIQLRTYLVQALTKLTVAMGMETGLVQLTPEGLRVIEHDKDTSKEIERSPNIALISARVNNLYNQAGRYIAIARKYMVDNPTAFPPPEEDSASAPTKIYVV